MIKSLSLKNPGGRSFIVFGPRPMGINAVKPIVSEGKNSVSHIPFHPV
jgi:hypothetical protein